MTYEQAIAYVASLEPRGWRLGLDRMAEFCRIAGLDDGLGAPGGPQFVHVAGTNGKGSTTAYLQSLMVEGGYRTGAYFSPYVVDPRERVQLGRELISKEEFALGISELAPIAESLADTPYGGITEFELKTALGFWAWKRNACEWVALEVGLGGRWDATNVTTPRAGIVVSIGWDHMHLLGDTLAKIAAEKAGIAKPGMPLIVGQLPPEALEVISGVVREVGGSLIQYGADVRWEPEAGRLCTPFRTYEKIKPGIAGEMQGHNLALAVAALEAAGCRLDEDAIRRGAERAYVPGRFETLQAFGTTFLLDGAHNVDAGRVLRNSVERSFAGRKIVVATNMIRGHEIPPFYEVFEPISRRMHVVPIDFHRAYYVAETTEALKSMGFSAEPHDAVEAGLRAAASEAGSDGLVLVTGSFYLVGEALRLLRKETAVEA